MTRKNAHVRRAKIVAKLRLLDEEKEMSKYGSRDRKQPESLIGIGCSEKTGT
jgi:hypothetical protein